jgi:multidrug efflux pump
MAESSAKGEGPIMAVLPWVGFLIATLLMIQLQSFSLTALVMLTAPLGMIGVAPALALTGRPFGFVAMLGVIALSGMIMRNSVILVDQIRQDVEAGKALWEAIVDSTVRRFRPIVLTAVASMLAMIPLLHNSLYGPMAVAIMGGLLIATILTCLFLPALYATWYRVRKPE